MELVTRRPAVKTGCHQRQANGGPITPEARGARRPPTGCKENALPPVDTVERIGGGC
jgi:hypothetical protein